MSFNGSGTFQINTAGQPVVSGTVISSTAFNALTADLATGLSTCITKDGQTTVTANIPMSNNKITGLANATLTTDAANLGQVQGTTVKLISPVSGADTITGSMTPALTAYAGGQMFYFIAVGDNTGPVTLNIDSLGAKAVTRDGSVALAAGDIKSGEVVVVVYDGTRFQVVSQLNSAGDARFANVSIASTLYVGGVATFTSGTAAAPAITTAGDTNTGIFFPAADTIAFTEGGAETMRLDSSGNLGLGVTPSAWNSGWKAFEITGVGSGIAGNGSTRVQVGTNHYLNSSSQWIYSTTDAATQYTQITGQHQWLTAASGTAGNAITFTQAMTLDASGNLGIGITSPAAGLHVANGNFRLTNGSAFTTGNALIREINAAAGSSNQFVTSSIGFRTDAFVDSGIITFGTASGASTPTERMRLDASGNLSVGTPLAENSVGAYLLPSGEMRVKDSTEDGTSQISIYNTNTSADAEQFFAAMNSSDVDLGNRRSGALKLFTNNSERARITAAGNFKVNGTADRGTTEGTGQVVVFNGTAPVGTLTNGVSFYAQNGLPRMMDATGEAFTVGYRNIPASGTKTGSYTLQTTDVGKYVQIGTGGSITIPDATFAEGDIVSLFNNTTGNITITCTITTAYIGGIDSDKATVTLATRGVATIFFISGTVCVINGNVS